MKVGVCAEVWLDHCNKLRRNPRGRNLTRLGLALGLGSLLALVTPAQTNVTTQHNDIARTGANTTETILTLANVNTTTFGRLFSQTVDGYVYAQPLYVAGVKLGTGTVQAGTTHNVVFVATENDSVYAFDADSNGGANASPLWKVSLIDSAHGAGSGEKPVPQSDVATTDIVPQVGITGTPVIDTTTNTMYVVAKSTVSDTTFIQRLHALDITTGAEKFGGPMALSGSVSGTGNGSSGGKLNFDPKWENQRPGLLLLNGIVYIGFAAHGDNGSWHGWILAYNASNLQQTSVWCSSANSLGSGVWMSGTGLAADVPSGKPYGRMFAVTGNGTFDALPTYTNSMSYGDSVVRLDLTNGVITVQDDFTPHDQASLNGSDLDQAAGGAVLLPDSVGGGGRQLVQIGKSGRVYVLNRESLGGYNANNSTDPGQAVNLANGLWGSPAYWNGRVYIWPKSDSLRLYGFANGAITGQTSISNESAGTYSPSPSISANGTTNGIVWSLKTDNFGSQGQAILYAHDATNVATLLYSSTQNATRDNPGASVKFAVPTITNGKVYVGTETQISVFGLLGGQTQAATPVISPVGQSFTGSLSVTITDSTSGATIYYTTDGSTPTTSSTKYTGAITVSTTETISAIASATGFVTSAVAKQTYTLQTQALMPTFSPVAGSYSSAQTVTISDTSPSSQIYYTTDGSTPSPGAGTTKLYSTALTISATTTINAIATATGLSTSPVASSTYTISSISSGINFGLGFGNAASSMTFNGSTGLDDTRLQLTNGGLNQAGSAFYNSPVNVQSFVTNFTFQLSNAGADGITLAIQSNGPTALGPSGGGLGYGPNAPGGTGGIPNSIAVKFDTYNNAGEGIDSTGLYTNGASPTTPAIDLTSSGIDLHSDDTMAVQLAYDGTTLSVVINDPVANKTFSTSWPINIPNTVGGTTAYVGFTGGTGGETSSQKIGSWTFVSTNGQATTAPLFSPAAGTYLGTQTVTITDPTAGSSISYTLDGTTPATTAGGSTVAYTGPITVTATQTINAIAIAPGYTTSTVSSALYTIESQVAAPSFSPAQGTYPTSQTVTISTTSAGATIYYTTNGTPPTKSSTEYTAPIPVSTTTTIQAIAVASGFFDSTVSSATYTIGSATATATPVFSLASGTYSSAQNVTISDATPGAAIYYTTNGTAPTTASTLYVGAITVSSSETIKAIAVAPAYSQSAVATAAYTITSSTEPDFSLTAASASMAIPFGGQGTSVITVTPKNGFASAVQLSCSVSGPAPMPTCAFSPTSVTPGASAVTSTLTIAVPTATAMVLPSSSRAVWQIPVRHGVDSNAVWDHVGGRPEEKGTAQLGAGKLACLAALLAGRMRQCNQQQSHATDEELRCHGCGQFGFDSAHDAGGSHGPVSRCVSAENEMGAWSQPLTSTGLRAFVPWSGIGRVSEFFGLDAGS